MSVNLSLDALATEPQDSSAILQPMKLSKNLGCVQLHKVAQSINRQFIKYYQPHTATQKL